MNKDSNIIIRTSNELKTEFNDIVYDKGYTISQVLNAFILEVVEKNKIPSNIINRLKPIKKKNTISIPFIKKCLEEILNNSNVINEVKKAYLFGSYARGEETPLSDVDIRLEVRDNFTLFDLNSIAFQLEEKTGKKVDLLTSGNLDEIFYDEIKKEEICIYSN